MVDKQTLRSAGVEALCRHQQCTYVQNTSGTTGDLFLIYRSAEEAQFIGQFFREVLSRQRTPNPRPLTLSLQSFHHGTPTPVPGYSFVLNASRPGHALQLLRQEYSIPGVAGRATSISGSLHNVLALTSYARAHLLKAEDCAVNVVSTTGDYMTARTRQALAAAWRADVVDRYSLSEIFGGATHCTKCRGFHFDPHVVPEVVDVATSDVVEDGIGVLLLTSLNPFVQLQPFVRYRTGDLFRVSHDVCPASYAFLGRVRNALFDPDNPSQLLLSGVDVLETFDAVSEIARTPFTQLSLPIAAGVLERESGRASIRLHAELLIDPPFFPVTVSRLRAAICEDLCDRSSALRHAVASGRIQLDVEFHPGGVSAVTRDLLTSPADFWTVT